jgi:cytochrome c-type biogenesis protein CcsB
MSRAALALLVALSPLLAGFTVPERTVDVLRRVPIQHAGRQKPFDSFAREAVHQITGAPRWQGEDPVRTVLRMAAQPDAWQAQPILAVPFRPLREALGLDPRAAHVSYDALVGTRALMRRLPALVEKQRHDQSFTMLDNETWDLYQRFVMFTRIVQHDLELVPAAEPAQPWSTIRQPRTGTSDQARTLQEAWQAFVLTLRAPEGAESSPATRRFLEALRGVNPAAYPPAWRLELEVAYNRFAPFHIAGLLYLGAFLALAASLTRWGARTGAAGWAAFIGAFAMHAAGILVRVTIGGRPPVSNFFETMLWLPFVMVALALAFSRRYRTPYFALASSLAAAVILHVAYQLPLDASITPVVAVLRSNLWLTIHVLTIVASYGALTLAAALAHVYAGIYLARRGAAALASLDAMLYRAIQVGVVLLAGGIMLGAVWANASWGRYWGWDPKETWALITLLWFLALLHGRFAGWLAGVWTAAWTMLGFFLLLMTYYGVSFYLVGLHSYAGGAAKPVPPLFIGYLAAECLLLAAVVAAAVRRGAASRGS